MNLNEESYEEVKELLKFMDVRKDRIIARIHNGDIAIVPSSKYPLSNKDDITIFTRQNTEELKNETIQKIYDGIEFKIGKCYENMRMLQGALLEKGITNFKVYVGWLFVESSTYPVHHCFIVYDDKYVLDPTMTTTISIVQKKVANSQELRADKEKLREEMVKVTKQLKKVASSKKTTFGRVLMNENIYIASECSIEDGEDIYMNLMERFPDHPIYQSHGMNPHGLSKVQQMIERG